MNLTFEVGRGLGNIISNGSVDDAAVEGGIGYLAAVFRDNGPDTLGNGKNTLHLRSTCMIDVKDVRSGIVTLKCSF